ncbi:MAG: hypothetical protein AB4060_01380 [Crocosphaera sp.]
MTSCELLSTKDCNKIIVRSRHLKILLTEMSGEVPRYSESGRMEPQASTAGRLGMG